MYSTLQASGRSENLTTQGVTVYIPFTGWFGGLDTTFETEAQNQTVVPTPFTMSNFFVRMSSAPGVGFSRTFTIRKNGVDTGIVVTIADNSIIGFDYTHTVDFAAGDLMTIKQTCIGSPQSGTYALTALCNSGNNKTQPILSSDFFGATISNSAVTYCSPMGGKFTYAAEVNAEQMVPAAGVLSNLYVYLYGSPGGTTTWTVTVRKNGVDSTLSVVLTGTNSLVWNPTQTLAVAAGDIISISITPAGSPSAIGYFSMGVAFTPTNPGDSIYGANMGGASASTELYSTLFGSFSGWNASDTDASYFEPGPGTVRNLYFGVSTAPGGSASWLLTLRKHFADTALALTLTGSATVANISHPVVYQPGDELTASILPTGTPTTHSAAFISWTMNQQGASGFLALLGQL